MILNEVDIDNSICKFAIAGGNIEIIHLCEQKGYEFEDCLTITASYHRFELFDWLNIHYQYEEIPLSTFVEYFNEPLFYYFISKGADAENQSDEFKRAPIAWAALNGQIEIVKYLIDTYHVSTEIKDQIGRTPFFWAAYIGHFDIVKYLYETYHSDIETKDMFSRTSIYWASNNGHYEVFKYLYETCHANVKIKDRNGFTILISAVHGDNIDIIKYLCETCKVNIEAKDNNGNTATDHAVSQSKNEIIEYLNDKGISCTNS